MGSQNPPSITQSALGEILFHWVIKAVSHSETLSPNTQALVWVLCICLYALVYFVHMCLLGLTSYKSNLRHTEKEYQIMFWMVAKHVQGPAQLCKSPAGAVWGCSWAGFLLDVIVVDNRSGVGVRRPTTIIYSFFDVDR